MNHRPPSERSFGVTVGLACIAVGALFSWRGHGSAATVFVTIGAVLLVAGLMAPLTLRVPNRLWWRFAQALAWINARVILTLFFLLVLTPVGLVMRLFGRNPLRPGRSDTNWSAYTPRRADPRHYERLF